MTTIDTVIEAVAQAAVEIRSGLADQREKADTENPSGETQLGGKFDAGVLPFTVNRGDHT